MARGNFEKVGRPAIIKYKHEAPEEQTWEAEHGLPERPLPASLLADEDVSMFEAAGLVES